MSWNRNTASYTKWCVASQWWSSMVGWCGFGGPTNKISRIELDPAAAYDEYTRKHTQWVEEGSKGPTKKIMFYTKRIFEWRDEYNVKRPVREESKNREGEPWWRWVHRERSRANARAVKSNCEQEWAQESKVNAWGMNEQTTRCHLIVWMHLSFSLCGCDSARLPLSYRI